MKRLVIDVLERERRPLLPAEVQRLIKSATGETLPRSSIKYALWAGSNQANGAFIREVHGYRLRDDV